MASDRLEAVLHMNRKTAKSGFALHASMQPGYEPIAWPKPQSKQLRKPAGCRSLDVQSSIGLSKERPILKRRRTMEGAPSDCFY